MRFLGLNDEIKETIRSFLSEHSRLSHPISVGSAVDHIRARHPDCWQSDGELSDIFAEHAIVCGFNLHFDGPSSREKRSLLSED